MDTVTIESEIKRTLEFMNHLTVDSEEYGRALKNLNSLLEAKKKLKMDTGVLISAATSLLSILLVMNHERLNVISTRALMFIRRSV